MIVSFGLMDIEPNKNGGCGNTLDSSIHRHFLHAFAVLRANSVLSKADIFHYKDAPFAPRIGANNSLTHCWLACDNLGGGMGRL
ncbi:hypothetical protein NUACC26_021050 [Scytonema sp. NUACC26]